MGRQLGFSAGFLVFELGQLSNFISGKRYKQVLTLVILKILRVCKVILLPSPQLCFSQLPSFSFHWGDMVSAYVFETRLFLVSSSETLKYLRDHPG